MAPSLPGRSPLLDGLVGFLILDVAFIALATAHLIPILLWRKLR